METLTTNPREPSDATAAAPRWMILNHRTLGHKAFPAADATTMAASCTSSGIPFSVSFGVAAPPDVSTFHCYAGNDDDNDAGSDDDNNARDLRLEIIAAHDDSVLIEATVPVPGGGGYFRRNFELEYFLYEAGAGRTPSLSLLPGCYVDKPFQRDKARYRCFGKNTGILSRGEGEVLVAQLKLGKNAPYIMAELCVLHGPDHDWLLKMLPIMHDDGESELHRRPEIDATMPIGSRFLCWIDYLSGFLVCEMLEENPKLRYVPLPMLPGKAGHYSDDRPNMRYCRYLAAAGPAAVRFVNIAPRCCCGGPGITFCKRSRSAFNVTTWTLILRMEEPMAWVKDGVFDCDELWQHPNYGCLPRVVPHDPIVSSDDPDVVCLMVDEDNYYMNGSNDRLWTVEVNTRSKEVLSVICSGLKCYNAGGLLPAKLRWL